MDPIFDGYSRYYSLSWMRLQIRPALHAERLYVLRQVAVFQEKWVLWETIKRHLVASNVDTLRELADDNLETVFHLCMNWNGSCEKEDAENLAKGVRLLTRHPRYAARDCDHCQKWWYNEDTGKIVEQADQPLLRPLYAQPLCRTTGCPKGTPENPNTLSRKNTHAWNHYLGCVATGSFPDDPLVRHNARIIAKALEPRKAVVHAR